MNIQNWLIEATKILSLKTHSARLDAEVLLAHILKKNRAFLFAYPDKKLDNVELAALHDLLAKRALGIPIAYLVQQQEFFSLPFYVNSDVLIPRADSECLIEIALSHLQHHRAPNILDLGAGSGALALTLAKNITHAKISATDISENALKVAKKNQQILGVKNVHFYLSDWFQNLPTQGFDLIISNPPYIDSADSELSYETKTFEPNSALISQDNGLADLKVIIEESRRWLNPKGMLIVEHGHRQQIAVTSIFKQYDYQDVHPHLDLSQKPRAVSAILKA